MDDFIGEGLTRFKMATETYWGFRDEVQNRLQAILRERKEWKPFVANTKKIGSTNYQYGHPVLDAWIECDLNGMTQWVVIALNWHESEDECPLCEVYVTDDDDHVVFKKETVRLSQKKSIFSLDEDFKKLLDALVQRVNASVGTKVRRAK